MLQIIDRIIRMPASIFDGSADNSGCRRKPEGFRDDFRRVAKAVLQIGAHRQVRSCRDGRHVLHHPGTLDRVVTLPGGKGIPHAGRCQRLKTQLRQQTRGTDVPGIGNDESAVTLMECPEGSSLFSLCRHGDHLILQISRVLALFASLAPPMRPLIAGRAPEPAALTHQVYSALGWEISAARMLGLRGYP